MLTTEEGKTHRFRDSQTLQKWVVERRVTRADRVCPPGGNWRRLGDVDELRPFFDVVAQADRAAAAARGARPTRPETPRGLAASRPYVSPDLDDDDVLGGKTRRSVMSGAFNDDISTDDDLAMAGIGSRHPGRKLLIAVVVVFVGLAAYLGFKGTAGLHLPGIGPASPPSAAPPSPPSLPSLHQRPSRRRCPLLLRRHPSPPLLLLQRLPLWLRLRQSPGPRQSRPRRAPPLASSPPAETPIRGATSI